MLVSESITKIGYCQCGCGQKTKLASKTCSRDGYVKGEPQRFIIGHNKPNLGKTGKDCPLFGRTGKSCPMYGRNGKDSPHWKGGRFIKKDKNTNYVMVWMPDYPRSNNNGYVFEHILVVERALGFQIGKNAVVHHIDRNGLNNKLSNLMVFKDNAEHTRFHGGH